MLKADSNRGEFSGIISTQARKVVAAFLNVLYHENEPIKMGLELSKKD